MVKAEQVITALSEGCIKDMIEKGVSFIWLGNMIAVQMNKNSDSYKRHPCYEITDGIITQKDLDSANVGYIINTQSGKIEQVFFELGYGVDKHGK